MYKNNQEIVNTVSRKMFKQKAMALCDTSNTYGVDINCMLRTPDGLRCAIGMLIPLKKYKLSFEDIPISNVLKDIKIISSSKYEDWKFIEFICAIREAHDSCEAKKGKSFWKEFSKNLRDVCALYELKIPKECIEQPIKKAKK